MNFCFCLQTYKGSHNLDMALEGIFDPDYQDFEILIGDDNLRDPLERRQATLDVVSWFKQSPIRYITNGTQPWLRTQPEEHHRQVSSGIIYLLVQQDVLAKGSLRKTYQVFLNVSFNSVFCQKNTCDPRFLNA